MKRFEEDALAEGEDGREDDGGDAGDEQAVLHGRGAALVLVAPSRGAVTRSSRLQQLGGEDMHGGS